MSTLIIDYFQKKKLYIFSKTLTTFWNEIVFLSFLKDNNPGTPTLEGLAAAGALADVKT